MKYSVLGFVLFRIYSLSNEDMIGPRQTQSFFFTCFDGVRHNLIPNFRASGHGGRELAELALGVPVKDRKGY